MHDGSRQSSDLQGPPVAAIPPQLMAALKWALASIGLSGLFIATGFIIDFAYQDRLGYNLGSREDLAGDSIEAGSFLLSVLLLSLTWLVEHPLVSGLVVAVLLLGMLRAGRRLRARFSRPLQVLGSIPVLVLAMILEIGIFDLPALHMHGVLVHGVAPPESFDQQPLIGGLVRDLWQDEVCSRIERVQYAAIQELGAECPLPPSVHESRGRSRFALNVLLTLTLAVLAVRRLLKERSAAESDAPAPVRRRARYGGGGILLLVVLLDCLLLPYSYGKTVRSTLASEVILSRRTDSGNTPEHGFLLYEKADAAVLFHKSEKHIWVVPAKQIDLVRIEGERDVVTFFLKEQLNEAARSAPPP